jgi:hypothetical protein
MHPSLFLIEMLVFFHLTVSHTCVSMENITNILVFLHEEKLLKEDCSLKCKVSRGVRIVSRLCFSNLFFFLQSTSGAMFQMKPSGSTRKYRGLGGIYSDGPNRKS